MTPKRITVHCSATPNSKNYDIEKIRTYHKSLGWDDVGYHVVIQPNGESQKGRYITTQGAGVLGENEDNLHICLVGTDLFSLQQFYSLAYYCDGIRLTYDVEFKHVYCHYEFDSAIKQGKTCPNIRAAHLVAWLYYRDMKIIDEYLLKEDRHG